MTLDDDLSGFKVWLDYHVRFITQMGIEGHRAVPLLEEGLEGAVAAQGPGKSAVGVVFPVEIVSDVDLVIIQRALAEEPAVDAVGHVVVAQSGDIGFMTAVIGGQQFLSGGYGEHKDLVGKYLELAPLYIAYTGGTCPDTVRSAAASKVSFDDRQFAPCGIYAGGPF